MEAFQKSITLKPDDPAYQQAMDYGQAIHALVDAPYSTEALGLDGLHVRETEPSLEDVFVSLSRQQSQA